MMSEALRIGQAQQGIEQKKLTDVVDTLYKGALIQDIENRGEVSRINAETAAAQLARRAPMELPGIGQLSFDEWKSLDTKTKAYSYYAFDAKQNNEEVMPYNEWSRQTNDPMAVQIYREALDDPEFAKWYEDKYKSGVNVNIDQQVEKAEAMDRVEARSYFTSPKGLATDVDKFVETRGAKMKLMQHLDDPETLEVETARLKEDFVDKKIQASGGKILGKRVEDNTIVWTVKWPDGKTSEVRYGF